MRIFILLTKTTAVQTEDALSYYRVRGIYFLAVVFVETITFIYLRKLHHHYTYIVLTEIIGRCKRTAHIGKAINLATWGGQSWLTGGIDWPL